MCGRRLVQPNAERPGILTRLAKLVTQNDFCFQCLVFECNIVCANLYESSTLVITIVFMIASFLILSNLLTLMPFLFRFK